MPPGFTFSRPETQLWLPMQLDPENLRLGYFGLNGVARIADGSTLEQVRAELGALLSNLVEIFPDQPCRADSGREYPAVDRPCPDVGGGRHRGDVVDRAGRGRDPAVDRLRQRHQPLPGPVRGASRRGGDARGPRREPGTAGRFGPHREPGARRGQWHRRASPRAGGGAPAPPPRPPGTAAAGGDLGRHYCPAVRLRGVRRGRPALRSAAGSTRERRGRVGLHGGGCTWRRGRARTAVHPAGTGRGADRAGPHPPRRVRAGRCAPSSGWRRSTPVSTRSTY